MGLPFASDTAVTRHLATFLASHAHAVPEAAAGELLAPDALLFNGGVMAAAALRTRVRDVVAGWGENGGPRVLAGGEAWYSVIGGTIWVP